MSDKSNQPPFLKNKEKLFIIAGPCVIESADLCRRIAEQLAEVAQLHTIDVIFKASYDKANRTSVDSFRGPGKERGLEILSQIKTEFKLPVLTDIHESNEASAVGEVADIIQIPAFLCRQTDLLVHAAKTGKWINIKKGQFMAPQDMRYSVEKVGGHCWLTERGTFFGYNRLVVDFQSIPQMKELGTKVVFDATHSIQQPGGGTGCSAGNREMAIPLARAAVSVGAEGLFFEVHPDPDNALCDGPNSLSLKRFSAQIEKLLQLHALIKS
ncbi:3-deoxy-8-phosphooctulonate synthase [Chitinispirillales bacterium ANBcel5]|uniref:3-deoxy-8-phosphooctulonate synthase n=1 Tax=Cellulosispirillum alkaliphilum TaxID=3039283 RepID=UPI002A5474B1|nr:3-deoxy-8-phosphooctulonate synthase [Chitinispirillales bacterium ANBcel5]